MLTLSLSTLACFQNLKSRPRFPFSPAAKEKLPSPARESWTLCPVLQASCLDICRAGWKVFRLSSWVFVVTGHAWLPRVFESRVLAGMVQIRLVDVRRAGNQRHINIGSLWSGGGIVKLKRTRLSQSLNWRCGGHPLADKTIPTDKALGVPHVCWQWYHYIQNLCYAHKPAVKYLQEGQPGQQKQIWCVSCTCPCAHAIKNSFAHNVYEKDASFSNNTYAKSKRKTQDLTLCCLLFDRFIKKEKVYSYKSLKKYDEYNSPQPSLKKRIQSTAIWNDHCCYRSALRELPGTSVLYRPPANHSFTLSGHSGGCLLHVLITK